MGTEWVKLDEFPNYVINSEGLVLNTITNQLMRPAVNQRGIWYVTLTKGGNHYARGLSKLVAITFLGPDDNPTFDTPINLDGNRQNYHVENLLWRPRWFAAKYHAQFKTPWLGSSGIQEIETRTYFHNAMSAAAQYGLLAIEVLVAAMNFGQAGQHACTVWPTGQRFRVVGSHIT